MKAAKKISVFLIFFAHLKYSTFIIFPSLHIIHYPLFTLLIPTLNPLFTLFFHLKSSFYHLLPSVHIRNHHKYTLQMPTTTIHPQILDFSTSAYINHHFTSTTTQKLKWILTTFISTFLDEMNINHFTSATTHELKWTSTIHHSSTTYLGIEMNIHHFTSTTFTILKT